MKKILFLFIITLIFSGCITVPRQIDDAYLTEITEEQSAKLDKIGMEIIAQKKEKDKVVFDQDIVKQKLKTAKKEKESIEINGELLAEKEKLYNSTNESEKVAEVKEQMDANKIKLTQFTGYIKYLNAKKDEIDVLSDIRDSELAVKVDELNYEKAMIAKAYQMKREEEFKKKMIDELDYKKILEDEKLKLEDLKKKYDKAQKETGKALDEVKKTGYEVK